MIKRSVLLILPTFLFALILIGATTYSPILAQDGGDHENEEDEIVLKGAVLYAEFCNACHGPTGEAIAEGSTFATITDYDPEQAEARIKEGYDSDHDDDIMMIGYGEGYDGPLSDAEVDAILAYMSTWSDPDVETPALPEPNLAPGPEEVIRAGNPQRGAELYAVYCLGCHGREAQGREMENFPGFSIDENTLRIVETGEGHGPVPAFARAVGGPLSTDDLDDLDAYLRTLEVDKDEDEDDAPEGVSTLLLILGFGAIGAVGAFYVANQRAQNRVADSSDATS
ncbi:MAG: c-type cytochrome [Chloroflexi bacterium]|nr:c-type cytochrome [Chloroflexota bacterium]